MEEKTVWKGSSSQVIFVGTYAVCSLLCLLAILLGIFVKPLLLCLLIVPIVIGLWKWIENRCRIYEITTERVRVTQGVLSKRTDELELYRVKDTSLVEPFLYRVAGAGNVVLTTIDVSTPGLTLEAVKGAGAIREELRKNVELCRDRKRVRVAELE